MTSLVLGVVGGVIGGMIGGPVGAQIGFAIGSGVGTMISAEDTHTYGPRKEDLRVQSNAGGTPIPTIWGTACVAGQVFHCTGIDEHPEEQTAGGKGGSTATAHTYRYTASVGVAVCTPIKFGGFRRIWANEILIYDISTGNLGNIGDVRLVLRTYLGGEEQDVDPTIFSVYGDKTPAYNDFAYAFFENLPLEQFGGNLPNFKFEMVNSETEVDSKAFGKIIYPSIVSATTIYQHDIKVNPVNNMLYVFRNHNITNSNHLDLIDPISKEVILSKQFNGGMYGDGTALERYINFNGAGNIVLPYSDTIRAFDKDTLTLLNTVDLNNNPALPDTTFRPTPFHWATFGNGYMQVNRRNISGDSQKLTVTTWGGNQGIEPQSFINYELSTRYLKNVLDTQTFNRGSNVVYFTTHGTNEAGNASRIVSLAAVNQGGYFNENIVTFYEDPSVQFQTTDLYYDEVSNSVFVAGKVGGISGTSPLRVYRIDLETLEFEFIDWTAGSGGYPNSLLNADTNNREFKSKVNYLSGDISKFTHLKMDTFVVTDLEFNKTENGFDVVPQSSCAYVKELDCEFWIGDYDNVNKNVRLFLNYGYRLEYATYSLTSIIREIVVQTGMPVTKLDLTPLAGIQVRGYTQSRLCTARSMLEQLALIFHFYAIESNKVVKFKLKADSEIVATISYEEMSARFYSQDSNFSSDIATQREMEINLPRVATLTYLDVDKDYAQNSQEAKKFIETTSNIMELDTPVVLNADEAKRFITAYLNYVWVSRDKFQWQTNYDYIFVECGDLVRLINSNNEEHIVRVTKIDESQGIIKFEGVAEEKTVYTQNGTGYTGLVNEPGIPIVARTNFQFIDAGIFGLDDDDYGMYVAVSKGSGDKWSGATVYVSESENGQYIELASLNRQSTMGTVGNPLGAMTSTINDYDYINTCIVTLKSGELYSVSDTEVDEGKNFCYIGEEYLQFKNATLIATKTYLLDTLVRGRFNSDVFQGTHKAGESFTLCEFNSGKLKRVERSNSNFGVEKFYKVASFGQKLDDVYPFQFTNNANGLKPYPVCNVIGARSLGNINITWDKRVRGLNVMKNGADQVDPDGDSYEIDILKAGVVVRTIKTLNQSTVYTSADQITDFGTVQSSVTLKVYKMSSKVGRGNTYQVIV